MKITRKSPITGKVWEMDIAVTKKEIGLWLDGTLIQNAMPNLTAAEREFILSGIHPEEWDRYLRM